jgi:hypothetical protein
MSNERQTDDVQIFKYLDGVISMKEKEDFEDSLKNNPVLQKRFLQLKMIHDSLLGRLETPSTSFTSKVMSHLAYTNIQINFSTKNGLLLLLGVGIALVLSLIFMSSGWFNQWSGAISLDQTIIPKNIIKQPLPTIPFNANLLMKILIGLNLVIVLVLFDRTILQPLFRNRMINHP